MTMTSTMNNNHNNAVTAAAAGATTISNTNTSIGTSSSSQNVNNITSWPVDYNGYKLIGKVGQGAFASVWRAECLGPSSGSSLAATTTVPSTGVAVAKDNTNDHEQSASTSFPSNHVASNNVNAGAGDSESEIANASASANLLGNDDGGKDDIRNNTTATHTTLKQVCAIKILDLEHVDTNFGGEYAVCSVGEMTQPFSSRYTTFSSGTCID